MEWILLVALVIAGVTMIRQYSRLNQQKRWMETYQLGIRALHETIEGLEAEVRDFERQAEMAWTAVQAEKDGYTWYSCPFCAGKGSVAHAGQVQGHPEKLVAEFPCDVCEGDGHLYKRKVDALEEERKTGSEVTESEKALVGGYREGVAKARIDIDFGESPEDLHANVMAELEDETLSEGDKAFHLGYMTQVVEILDLKAHTEEEETERDE